MFWVGGLKISKNFRVNEQIWVKEALVVGGDGSNLGLMSVQEALDKAGKQGLDLVEVQPQAEKNGQVKNAVCKMMDYDKFRYEQKKKEKESKKNRKATENKEVRLSVNIGENDFLTKTNQAVKFLSDGNSVKVSIRFKGRENNNVERGRQVMLKFSQECASAGNMSSPPQKPPESKIMTMFLTPKPLAEMKEKVNLDTAKFAEQENNGSVNQKQQTF